MAVELKTLQVAFARLGTRMAAENSSTRTAVISSVAFFQTYNIVAQLGGLYGCASDALDVDADEITKGHIDKQCVENLRERYQIKY